MTWERRRPALGDRLRGESGPIGETGQHVSKAGAAKDFESANNGSVPREGDSRCSPAFRVAAAWREMEGCLAGELNGWPSPFRALGSSFSSDIVVDKVDYLGSFLGKVLSIVREDSRSRSRSGSGSDG